MAFLIKTGATNMNLPAVHDLLGQTYWAHDRPAEVIEESMARSECYGAFTDDDDRQVGFARVVTDHATFFWLCDVVVDADFRGRGIGKLLMDAIKSDPKYRGMVGLLSTDDARGLYEAAGFTRTDDDKLMLKPKGV